MSEVKKGYICILIAAALWATLGPFAKLLYTHNISPMTIAYIRATLAFVIMLFILVVAGREHLRVRPGYLPLLALYGLFGIAIFYSLYMYSIEITTIATAVFLLYTAPIFVTLLGRLIFKEALTWLKLMALSSSILGLFLLTAELKISTLGIMAGVGSGLTYALMSILGKAALRRHSPWTVIIYGWGFGCLFLTVPIAIGMAPKLVSIPFSSRAWLILLTMAFFPTLGAVSLYTWALKRVEASRASIIATLEPVMASLIGVALFDEHLTPAQAIGGGLVIVGAALAQMKD